MRGAPGIRRALRSLASRPVLACVAIATLALGIGVNAAVFSLTREMLLRPLPYRDADRLVRVFEASQSFGVPSAAPTPPNYLAWRDQVEAFEQTAAFRRVAFNVWMTTAALQVEGFQVEPTFFPMLGVEPALGRGFTPEDAQPGRDGVVLLSHGFWRRQFAADAAAIGRSIDVDGTPCTIVGILPASFQIFRVLNRELDVFRPLVLDPTDREHSINLYAKLRTGVPIGAARAQLATAYSTLPIPNHAWTADLMLLSDSFAANSRSILIALQWAVGVVLLIACANIANLLLAFAIERQKELAVRQALGAAPWQIARDLAGEPLVLAVAGGALALLLATWIVAVLNATISFQHVNRLQPFRVDSWVLGFTAALVAGVTAIFGLVPIRAASRVDPIDALKDSTQGSTTGAAHRRLRHALVVAELALSIVLAASALALTRSALGLQGLPRGLNVDHVVTAQLSLSGPRYTDTGQLVRTVTSMLDRLRASAGVSSAALVNYPPLSLIRLGVPVSIDGQAPSPGGQSPVARYWVAAPNYFHTLGIPMLTGRDFTDADDADRPGVAIVSETFARRFWSSTDVVGRRLRTEFPQSEAFWIPRARREPLTIVGVVRDVREDGLPDAAGLPQLYLPFAQNPPSVVTLMARGNSTRTGAAAIRAAVHAIDPQSPVGYEQTLDEVMRETFARPRELAWLVGVFAALAIVLSAAGVYGTMAYATTMRSREIGIRTALGATPRDIARLVLGHATAVTAVGIAIGVVVAPAALLLVRSVLFGVGPLDPLTLLAVAGLLGLVAMSASTIPAVRAARQNEKVQGSRFRVRRSWF